MTPFYSNVKFSTIFSDFMN